MAKDFDDYEPRDDDFPERGELAPGIVQAARKKCGTPGLILVIFGLIGILLEVVSVSVSFTRPYFIYDQVMSFYEGMPPGPDRDKVIGDFKQQKEQMRGDKPLNLVFGLLGVILNVLMVVGGRQMRALKGYGLAMTGAICGVIPLGGCFCCAMPIGIWAIIVLCNADVKRAFATTALADR